MNREIWKPIKDYEGLYEVSNMGRVRSLDKLDTLGKKIKGKMLKLCNKDGYLVVNLTKDGKSRLIKVHRLVGFAFVEGWFEGAFIDHIDGNRANNVWTNLHWVTQKENMNNPIAKERIRKAHKGRKLSYEHRQNISKSNKGHSHTEETKKKMSENTKKKKVYCIELNKVFESISEASRELNLSPGHISEVCNGKRKHEKGYHFIYYKEEE